MEENQPAHDVCAEEPKVQRGDDYEYDEAHDAPAGPVGAVSAPQPGRPPEVTIGTGGDYGYDQAHDLGIR